jgi:hypothetical protein
MITRCFASSYVSLLKVLYAFGSLWKDKAYESLVQSTLQKVPVGTDLEGKAANR